MYLNILKSEALYTPLQHNIRSFLYYVNTYSLLHMPISDRIKELRKSLDMSQKEFGDSIGVGTSHVSQWERELSMPSGKALTGIARLDAPVVGCFLRLDILHTVASNFHEPGIQLCRERARRQLVHRIPNRLQAD